MQLYAVTPIHVPDDELARRQDRYRRLCPPGVALHLVDLGVEAPTAMDNAPQITVADGLVEKALRAAPGGCDGMLPDCVLDPAVLALSGVLDVPVFGMLRLSVGYAVSTGRKVGAVARNRAIADALDAQIDAYGWSGHFVGTRVLDLDFDAVADSDRWNATLHTAIAELSRAGAEWIINGCSAVDVSAESADPSAARVIDPVAMALALVGAGEVR